MCKWRVLIAALLVLPVAHAVAGATDEQAQMRSWAQATFLGGAAPAVSMPPGLEVRRQDYEELRLRQSILKTPLQIGDRHYDHGFGTHSVSEVVVRLPGPAKLFEAQIGIDNNYNTAGQHGSVIFTADVGGKELFRSELCRGGEAPRPAHVALNGATEFTLHVLDGGDGPGWDHSDWADAAIVYEDGKRAWLDEMPIVMPPARLATHLPFSFVYGGKPSTELLPKWKRMLPEQPKVPGKQLDWTIYEDPDTKLQVTCELRRFDDFPAVEWVLRFANAGTADTPIIEGIRPLDLRIAVPSKGDVVLHHAYGSTCAPTDFMPLENTIAPKSELSLSPGGGRSSNGHLPFFNLAWPGGGLVGAIGWTGQWSMRLARSEGRELTLQAGQQFAHFKLHPGENVRTPRILLLQWQGDDRLRGHNLLRRLLVAHYVPRIDGEVAMPPIAHNTWFTFHEGNDVTEANQLECIAPMAPMGVEAYWLDAGWFEGGWPAGAGSWVPKKAAFPRGLRPLGDAARKDGMKFVLWFEPERVNPSSRIAKEHPEWVLRVGNGDGLFNLGDPAARQWLTDYLSKCITDWGIGIYRNDFNIDPLPFWQKADTADRQGITEIRYVEGLYAMWDALRERHPGVPIDNCASGGRRIDLETVSRSFPLTRSDSPCVGKPLPVQDQNQTAGLSLYVPLHASLLWSVDPYPFRSVVTAGTSLCMDTRPKGYATEQARRMIAEAKALRPLWLGDYYPLLEINQSERHWAGWQFDRPDLGKGFAMFFRRAESPYVELVAELHGLDAAAKYDVTFADTREERTMTGGELAKLAVKIDAAPGSALITYEKVK